MSVLVVIIEKFLTVLAFCQMTSLHQVVCHGDNQVTDLAWSLTGPCETRSAQHQHLQSLDQSFPTNDSYEVFAMNKIIQEHTFHHNTRLQPLDLVSDLDIGAIVLHHEVATEGNLVRLV